MVYNSIYKLYKMCFSVILKKYFIYSKLVNLNSYCKKYNKKSKICSLVQTVWISSEGIDFTQVWYWLTKAYIFDSFWERTPVSKMAAQTTYGSILEAGLLSSTYPLPLACIVAVGILNEAALLPQP